MHIVWLILKIIGIILAIILGVVIALILTVLLVPIRYRINGSKKESIEKEKEELKFQVLISWLLRIILVKIEFEDRLSYSIKIFGFTIKKNQTEEEQDFQYKNQTQKKKKKERKKQIQKKPKQKKLRQETLEQEKARRAETEQENQSLKERLPDKEQRTREQVTKEQLLEEETKQESIQKSNETRTQQIKTEQTKTQQESIKKEKQEFIKEEKQNFIEIKKQKKPSIVQKIMLYIFQLFDKIKNGIRKIRICLKETKNNIDSLLEKGKKILSFLREEQNKVGFGALWNIAKLILKHIKPTKLKLELQLGTGEPCSTGQVLGILGILYGCYGEGVQINPDFEHAILQGTIMVKGRIRLGSLLIIGIKLLLNKEIRALWNTVQQLKEEL